MGEYYAAIDIGASSGRLILGRAAGGRLELLDEIYRFKNGALRRGGHLCWDLDGLFGEILSGLKMCADMGVIPVSLGIDTWGVDFVLLDKNGERTGDCVAYRDSRTDGCDALLRERMTEEELYKRTGIAKQPFNTVYQLMALKRENPAALDAARDLLLVPEYLTYLLTGEKPREYTNATTTGLVGAASRDWDDGVIAAAGIPRRVFGEISRPGAGAGRFRKAVREQVGFDCAVTLPCTHDTASAVMAAPVDGETLFLSSGTWSLMGAELEAPVLTERSRECGMTNEGGFGDTYRYLKNIMGLWILQRVRRELDAEYTFSGLAGAAEESSGFPSRVSVDDNRFLSPDSMIGEIKACCLETGQPAPRTAGEIAYCVYSSLAAGYAETAAAIEKLTNRRYKRIAVIGGGSRDALLNRLTAGATGKTVTAGPAEATAIGNIAAQMMAAGEISGIGALREMIEYEIVRLP